MKKCSGLVSVFICSLLFAVCGLFAQNNNYSNLLSRDLSLETNLADIFMNEAFGGDCTGKIDRINVTNDSEIQLKLSVTYSNFQNCMLIIKLLDDKYKELDNFKPFQFTPTQSSGTVEAVFNIEIDKYKDVPEVNVPKLRVAIARDENAGKYKRYTYNLNKSFKTHPSAENIVTDIVMNPIGSAANLGKGAVKPAVVKLPTIKIYQKLDNAKLVPNTINAKNLYLNKVDTSKLNIKKEPSGSSKVSVAVPKFKVINPKFIGLQPVHPATTGPANADPQGPGDMAIPLFESLVTDYDFEYPFEITNIRLDIYPDKNKESGIFYFLPAAYQILFDENNWFDFKIDYGTQESGTESTVRMGGRLSPGIGKKEIDIVKELLKTYISKNPQFGYKVNCELRAMQIDGAPTVSFDTDLKQYNITNQTVNAPSLSEPLTISWRTDEANATDISNSLKANVGIVGMMKLTPKGGTLTEQSIPVRIRLADERTIGRFVLDQDWRNKNWKNISPYPVKLKNLHVIWVNNNVPAVYTWRLGDKEILAGSQVKFNSNNVPLWLDNEKNARFWLEYEIQNCEACHDSVVKKVILSSVRPLTQQVKFKLLNFFQSYKIVALSIAVRTRQADPAGETLQNLPEIMAEKDNQDVTSANIYVLPGADPDFEFRMQVIAEDGKEYISDWKARKTLLVPIGSSQIDELFPQLKPN